MKNRTLIGILCIVLSLVLAFGIIPLFSRSSEAKAIEYRTVHPLTAGHLLTEEDITAAEVSRKTMINGVVTDKNRIVGMYTTADMFSGDTITAEKLSETADTPNDILRNLDGTQVAVSVTIPSFAGGLSAKLQNGDIVSFIAVKDGIAVIPDELRFVRIITTTTAQGVDNTERVPREDGTYELPSTVTVLATPEQACKLAEYEANGKLHVSLVYRGDKETAQQYLNRQSEKLVSKDGEANG